MKTKIKLIYWNKPNFGDILSPYIINQLSQQEVLHKNFYRGSWGAIKSFIKCIVTLQLKRTVHINYPFDKNILGIGSIISLGNKNSIVWGSGFMNENEIFRGGQIFAVRGKLTNNKLINQGYRGCNVFGDPALLVPLLISPNNKQLYEIGIIPHIKETEYFKAQYSHLYKIIDLRSFDVKKIIQEITSCKYILSTSLHGIIVSHAYNIPALWIKHGYIDTDGFKFKDYFSSVNIPEYEGFTNIDSLLTQNQWKNLFNNHSQQSLPNIDIKIIQNQLLKVAPFPIKFKNLR